MNALRKQSEARPDEALARFSATLDADAHGVMESLDFIAGNPAPANPDSNSAGSTPELAVVKRRAGQLATLVNVIGVQFGGVPEDLDDVGLVSLAADLAAQLHAAMERHSGHLRSAYGKTGQLTAITHAMCDAVLAVERAEDDAERLAAANQFGWLQDAADDIANSLIGRLEAKS